MNRLRKVRSLLAAGLAVLAASPAGARTLEVGNGRQYKLPSEALAAAADGDVISIAPGEYFDCAIVRTSHLTIQGEPGDAPAVMSDKVCESKALLVLRGDAITVRNLTLQRARVPDGNGAGIRLERPDLTVDRVRFVNNQVGILTGADGGTIDITDSLFTKGGVGGERPKFALMIDHSARLRVSNCTFADVKGGLISTKADRTQVIGSKLGIGAGDEEEFPTYAVLATEGDLLMENDVITVGPMSPRPGAAIGVWDGATATIRDNQLLNRTELPLALVKDWSWNDLALVGNAVGPRDSLVASSGVWRHRASTAYYERKAQARALASAAKQTLKQWLGR